MSVPPHTLRLMGGKSGGGGGERERVKDFKFCIYFTLASSMHACTAVKGLQYNTTLLSLCRQICFRARHLHENVQ